MSQLDGTDTKDLEKWSLSTTKVMLAASQLRPEEEQKEQNLKLLRKRMLNRWVGITKPQILLAIFALVHLTAFAHGFFYYYSEDDFVAARYKFGIAFPIASAAGSVLHIDLAILIFPVCRNLVSIVRRRLLNNIVDLDSVVSLHKLASWSLVFFAYVHSCAYCCGLFMHTVHSGKGIKGFLFANFATGPGLSGHLMLLLLNVIAVTSLKGFRRTKFKIFWSVHHLFILFFVLWAVHGSFCVIKTGRTSSCVGLGAFWQYWFCGAIAYLAERIMREWYGRNGTPISKVIQHPGNVVEMHLKKNKIEAKLGQYIYLCCPEVSTSQDHRYLLSSAPEEDYLSIHINGVTNFAKSWAAKLGCDFEQRGDSAVIGIDEKANNLDVDPAIRRLLPPTFIDGPLGGLNKDIFQFEVAVLSAVGVEVAPFASILKSIWYRMSGSCQESRLRKVYFFWTCPQGNFTACGWFRSLLAAIEAQDINHQIEIYTYLLSGPAIAGTYIDSAEAGDGYSRQEKLNDLRVPTELGQPEWRAIFHAIHETHTSTKVAYLTHSPDYKGLMVNAM